MGEVVNLRRVRKTKAREAEVAQADTNRARFGMTKTERTAEAKRRAAADKKLDGARLTEESHTETR